MRTTQAMRKYNSARELPFSSLDTQSCELSRCVVTTHKDSDSILETLKKVSPKFERFSRLDVGLISFLLILPRPVVAPFTTQASACMAGYKRFPTACLNHRHWTFSEFNKGSGRDVCAPTFNAYVTKRLSCYQTDLTKL